MTSINENCIGCGLCVSLCEEVFEIKDGKASVKKGKEKLKLPCVEEAIDSCPVQAINA